MEKQNIPKLRFPEFKGEWEKKKLGVIAELTSSKRVYISDYVDEGIPFYRGKEISELKRNVIPKDVLYISKKAYKDFKNKYGVPQKDDILITAVGTLGNVLRINDNSPFYFKDGNLIWIRKITVASEFLEIVLEYNSKAIDNSAIGSSQKALTMVELRKLIFNFPTLPEQQKIASFLSAVDKKIQQLQQKEQLLQQYKKSMMQKLFSRQTRFKDDNGNNYPEWEEKTLGEVTRYVKGFAFKSTDYTDNGVRIVRVSDLLSDRIKSDNEKVFLDKNKVSLYDKYILRKGNIIITTVGSKPDMLESAVGRGIYIKHDDEGLLNQNMLKFENIDNVNNAFLIGLINSEEYRTYMKGIARGNANQANITVAELLNYKISVPYIKEQTKIANFLTAIDDKINVVSNEIDNAKAFKKGLLQQLFV